MDKKHNKTLTIVALATLLITVISATFAYFGATVNKGSGSTLSTVIEEDDVLFTATGANMSLEVTPDKMTQQASIGGTIVAGESSDSAINVNLTVGSTNPIACSYNIYFKWDSANTAYLTKTSGATKELTVQLSLSGGGSAGTNKFANETQLTDAVTTANKTLVVEKATIYASNNNSGTQTWVPSLKFYNLQLNQSALANKSFAGKFTVGDVECSSVNTLSEKILAKASDKEYTSSQNQYSKYKIMEIKKPVEYERITLSENDYGTIESNAYKIEYDDSGMNSSVVEIEQEFFSFDNYSWNSIEIPETNADINGTIDIKNLKSGNYHLCYEIENNSPSTIMTVYLNDTSGINYNMFGLYGTYEVTCTDMFEITEEHMLHIEYIQPLGYYAQTRFYLEKIEEKNTGDRKIVGAGVRYQGGDPDNYIKFNGDEEWRIIGVFEGTSIGLEPGKQYTKIIKNANIGYYSWDCSSFEVGSATGGSYCISDSENDWKNSTLYTYLNGTYLNGLTDKNKIAKYNNQYSTWYLRGHDTASLYAEEMFYYERTTGQPGYRNGRQYAADTEVKSAIGLLYPSDLGFSVYNTDSLITTGTLSEYSDVSGYTWLSNMSFSYFITPVTNNASLVYAMSGGGSGVGVNFVEAGAPYYNEGFTTYPTLYLEANLTATGSGTKIDPYVLN